MNEPSTPSPRQPAEGFDIKLAEPNPKAGSSVTTVLVTLLVLIGGFMFFAVPCFMPAQTRSFVSRAQSDMRSLSTALLAYHTDNGAFPPWVWGRDEVSVSFGSDGYDGVPTFKEGAAAGAEHGTAWGSITTPIGYATAHFYDPFSPMRKGTFAYVANDAGFLLVSHGPDEDFDMPFQPFTPEDASTQQTRMLPHLYDPTNGTESNGDVVLLHRLAGGGASERSPGGM